MSPRRRPLLDRYDGIVLTFVTLFLLSLILTQGADLRRFNAALGVAVFGLILWRLVSTWDQLTVLEHALSLLLATSPLVASAAQFYLSQQPGTLPENPLLWIVVAHRVCCLILVLFWTRWIGRRHSPFRCATPGTGT